MAIFDQYWWMLVLPAFLISLWAQFKVKSTFKKYSKVPARMTGADASRMIQRQNGISVPIESSAGSLTDHFDPRRSVIRLSEPVGNAATVSAVGVAAHETGHALQYARQYFPIKLRTAILPPTQISSTLAPWVFFLGLWMDYGILAYVGLAMFGLALVFQILTLPVEFNASARACAALAASGEFSGEQLAGVRKVLNAAALTYVAAMLVSLMSFVRLLLLTQRRRR